jgi:hypothetical protein
MTRPELTDDEMRIVIAEMIERQRFLDNQARNEYEESLIFEAGRRCYEDR